MIKVYASSSNIYIIVTWFVWNQLQQLSLNNWIIISFPVSSALPSLTYPEIQLFSAGVFFWEIAVKIPSQKRTLENLTSKTAVQIPSKKTNSRKSNLRFPRKILYYVFYNLKKKSVSWLLTLDSGPAFHWFVSATIRTMRENCVTTARTTWRQEAQPAPRWSDTSFQIHLFI